jgi:hypothetical protein
VAIGREIEARWKPGTTSKRDRLLLGIALSHAFDVNSRLVAQVSGNCVHALGECFEGPEEQAQCAILRDMFPKPFGSVTFSPCWRTDVVLALASQMYESRDFSAMPILADALQDAGCENEDILNHCRSEGVHVRGCWVIDLSLGKG